MSYTPPSTSGNTNKKVVQLAYSASITPNATNTDIARITLTGSPTINAPTGNPFDGQQILFELTQDTVGGRTVTWNAIYDFSDDITTPILSTGAGKTDKISFRFSARSNKWEVEGRNFGV